MIGSLFAGTDEAPGKLIKRKGKLFKNFRGMGSVGAMNKGSADRYFQSKQKDISKYVPEGVEGLAKYKGKVIKVDNNFITSVKEENDFESNKSYLEFLCSPQNFSETDGKYIGDHNGAFFYTVGQRKGLDIGGFKDPLFVIMKDIDKNILYVGMGSDHPALFKKALFISNKDIHWVRNDLTLEPNETMEVYFRVRYRQPLEKGKIFMYKSGLFILFDRPISSIASGQFASWYIENELIGSGVIS